MKLFFYKPDSFNPIIFLITKISNNDEAEMVEALSHELFHILVDHKYATNENILIISLIRDHDETTTNLIIPSTKSNEKLVTRCTNEKNFINSLIVTTLKKFDTEFYFEYESSQIKIHPINLNLHSLAAFYKPE